MSNEKVTVDVAPFYGLMMPIAESAVRGMMAMLPMLRGEMALIAICNVLGRVMGKIYIGDPRAVHKFRRVCLEAFTQGVKSEPVQQAAPVAPQAADTAIDLAQQLQRKQEAPLQ